MLRDNNTLCLVADTGLLGIGPCAPISELQQWRLPPPAGQALGGGGGGGGTVESVGESNNQNGRQVCLTAGPPAAAAAAGGGGGGANVTVAIDVAADGRRLNHVWKSVVGSGHAALTLRRDWQDHLRNASVAAASRLCGSTAYSWTI
eukprot:SAG22_NODE_364_length_11652_cov_5.071497_6_plen_147_part_00